MKIYLDTFIISAYFDSRNPELQELTEDYQNIYIKEKREGKGVSTAAPLPSHRYY